MADIFISYSRQDSEQAQLLTERLRANGASVWMDTSSLGAAETWSGEIVTAIENCSHFIVLLSEASVKSVNVGKETSLASEAQKVIVPIELGPCELGQAMKYALAGLQRVSLHDEVALERSLIKLGLHARLLNGNQISTHVIESELEQKRIAVLPFEDQSPTHDNEWFSDGLTDELISTLNKLDALFVLDRQTSKLYRGAKLTAKQIASELHVRYIVTGAVRKAGDKLRIHASLVDTTNGATLWAEKFSGTMEDIFDIQEKTALDIVEGLKLKLTPEERVLFIERMTNYPEAYELYLRAIEVQTTNRAKAIEYSKAAIELDPNFLPAYQSLSIQYSNSYRHSVPKNQEWLELERETIRKMEKIAPNAYFGLAARANYYLNIGEEGLALQLAERAVEAYPRRAAPHHLVGFVNMILGRYEVAIEPFCRSIAIDPMAFLDYGNLFCCAIACERWDVFREYLPKAKPIFERQIRMLPDDLQLRCDFMNFNEAAGETILSQQMAEEFEAMDTVTVSMHLSLAGIFTRHSEIERGVGHLRFAIEAGVNQFDANDVGWFAKLEGTPEYQYILDHIKPQVV